jgi:DNA mismatch repair protein MutS
MRQVGLTVILAQIGCMVPAAYARLAVTDRLFTRVGAVDDVSLGQSTFQVEMAETAAILSQATAQSLVLLDEIGRGTAVADGIAIAWAVAEHMAGARFGATAPGGVSRADIPRTLFVTHYHELNVLAGLKNVEAFHMQIVQSSLQQDADCLETNGVEPIDDCGEEWMYTHRILPGPSWESHGLAIARRAGFPQSVLSRAEEVLAILQAPAAELSSHLRRSLLHNDCDADDHRPSPITSYSRVADLAPECKETQTASTSSEYDAGFLAGISVGRADAQRELNAYLDERFKA